LFSTIKSSPQSVIKDQDEEDLEDNKEEDFKLFPPTKN
jgi:hypothetical protein